MIAPHFLAFSAAMIESNVVFWKTALTPICAATWVAMSMSEPTNFVPCSDSSGGYVASVQKTILPADLIVGGGFVIAAATAATAPAATAARSRAIVLLRISFL